MQFLQPFLLLENVLLINVETIIHDILDKSIVLLPNSFPFYRLECKIQKNQAPYSCKRRKQDDGCGGQFPKLGFAGSGECARAIGLVQTIQGNRIVV